jgi:hypothetical protein
MISGRICQTTFLKATGNGGQHLWVCGYFCAAAGELTKEKVQEYKAHHFEKHENPPFEVE